MSSLPSTVVVDGLPPISPLSSEFISDPYPTYRAIRERGGLLELPLNAWLVGSYEYAQSLLRDRRLTSDHSRVASPLNLAIQPGPQSPILDHVKRWMLNRDGVEHVRLRKLVGKVFTPSAIQRLVPAVEQLVDELLDEPIERGSIDVMTELAQPLPTAVICQLLGVPLADRDQCRRWSDEITALFDPVPDPALRADAERAATEFAAYIGELFDERKRHPGNALFDDLIAVEEAGDRLSRADVISNTLLIFGAGHETTTNLIGNGALALMRNRGQREIFRHESAIRVNAIEELLRYDAPVQMTFRSVLEEIPLGDRVIPANSGVLLLLASANRDEARYERGEELDLRREDPRSLAFGFGAHYCIGAVLARMEARVALGRLFDRTARLRATGESVRYRRRVTLRGLESLRLDIER